MKKQYFILWFVILLFYSCQGTDSNKVVSVPKTGSVADVKPHPQNDQDTYIDSLINITKEKGDTNAYKIVHVYYAEKLKDREILDLSILMAHKYKYNYAYFTVYTTLVNQEAYGLKDLDEQTQNLALYYLFRSYELGYKDALYTIRDDLGKNAPIQKSSYYLNKMIEYDSKK